MSENNQQASKLADWMIEHMDQYLATDGAEGHIWRGVPTLLLTTTGRRSGKPQMLPLIYGEDNGNYVIVASKGGTPNHPAWYLNLVARPQVDVQVAADKFTATARDATEEERPRLWDMMAKIWPQYNDYQAKTDRQIPVVVLERQ